jgi:hypothetical protein
VFHSIANEPEKDKAKGKVILTANLQAYQLIFNAIDSAFKLILCSPTQQTYTLI